MHVKPYFGERRWFAVNRGTVNRLTVFWKKHWSPNQLTLAIKIWNDLQPNHIQIDGDTYSNVRRVFQVRTPKMKTRMSRESLFTWNNYCPQVQLHFRENWSMIKTSKSLTLIRASLLRQIAFRQSSKVSTGNNLHYLRNTQYEYHYRVSRRG